MAVKSCRECGNPVSTDAKTCPSCGVPSPTKAPPGWRAKTLLVIGSLAFFTWCFNRVASVPGTGGAVSAPDARAAYADSLDLEIKWNLGGFDNVMIADFTVKNTGSRSVKDLELDCTMSGKSGTDLGAARKTLYEVVPAGKTKTFRDVNMGIVNSQSSSSRCGISGFEWAP